MTYIHHRKVLVAPIHNKEDGVHPVGVPLQSSSDGT